MILEIVNIRKYRKLPFFWLLRKFRREKESDVLNCLFLLFDWISFGLVQSLFSCLESVVFLCGNQSKGKERRPLFEIYSEIPSH